MTAVAYAMSDFAGVKVPEDRGGCGEQHEGIRGEDGSVRVECDACAPLLTGGHYGFAATPDGVPLTPDEMAHAEALEHQAKTANAATDAELRRAFLRSQLPGAAPSAPSLLEQIRNASPEERAALRDLLSKGDGTGDGGDLADLHVAQLKKVARERGVDDSGSKADVLARLTG